MRTLSLMLGAGALIGFGGGCFITNTAHCGYHENGADNPCPEGFVCSVCAAENNGCVPQAQADAIEASCRESGLSTTTTPTDVTGPTSETTQTTPTTTQVTTETTTTSTTVAVTDTSDTTATTTETSTTEAPATTEMTPCDPEMPVNQDCAESNQYCVGPNQCGFCTSLEVKTCTDVDPNTPACDSESGQCVQCTEEDASACMGATPACDLDTHTCVPCTEHMQCANTACDIEKGECFPDDPESIIFVKNIPGGCPDGDGTELKPFCNLAAAQSVLEEGKPTTIKVIPGQTAMPPWALPVGNFIVAVRAEANTPPELDGGSNIAPTIEVRSGNRVYLWKLKLNKSNAKSIVRCNSLVDNPGILYADDTRFFSNGNKVFALEASNCKVRMRRSRVWRCGGGVQLTGGSLRVDATSFTDNGIAGTSAFGAFNFTSPGEVVISYSSLIDHPATNSSSTFACAGTKPAGGIKLRNSAVINFNPLENANCAGWVEPTTSLVQGAASAIELNDFKANAVGSFSDGAYSVKKDGSLKDLATWGEGDPAFDVNLTPIPKEGPTYAGSDQPVM